MRQRLRYHRAPTDRTVAMQRYAASQERIKKRFQATGELRSNSLQFSTLKSDASTDEWRHHRTITAQLEAQMAEAFEQLLTLKNSCKAQHAAASQPNKLAYRMLEAESVCGISKAKLYEEIAAGRLKSVKVAGRRLILRDDLEAFLRGGQQAAA
jgi:excisionase family DNA binding protein